MAHATDTNARTDPGRAAPLPSLLADAIPPPQPGPGPTAAREPIAGRLRRRAHAAWASRAGRRVILAGAAVILVGAGVGAWLALRPAPMPDFVTDDLDDVLDFALLQPDFNRLPLDERLRLVGQIIQRLGAMDGADSELLAAFAAGIAGPARKQLEENVSLLAVELWDRYALGYAQVPGDQRGAYLERSAVEFTRMMEGLAGETRDISDEERLREMRAQAEADEQALRDPSQRPGGRQAGRMFRFMDDGIGGHASPQQRARGGQLMRDMVRHLRGRDLGTGLERR